MSAASGHVRGLAWLVAWLTLSPASVLAQPVPTGGPHVRVAVSSGTIVAIADDGRVVQASSTYLSARAGTLPASYVEGVHGARSVVTSDVTSCALLESGDVVCWAPLGLTAHDRGVVTVPALHGAAQIAHGGFFVVCGRFADGHASCVARDGIGFVGAEVRLAPTDLVDLGEGAIGTRRDGSGVAWDRQGHEVEVSDLRELRADRFFETSVAGDRHAYCILQRGRVLCLGELTPWGGEADVVHPTVILLPGLAVDVVLHASGGCALLADARVACWPASAPGSLPGPIAYALDERLAPARAVGLGMFGPCALLVSGRVRCGRGDLRDLATDVLSPTTRWFDAHEGQDLAMPPSAAASATPTPPTVGASTCARVADPTGTALRVRERPNGHAAEIAQLANGTLVTVRQTRGSWARIDAPSAGWVWRPYLEACP